MAGDYATSVVDKAEKTAINWRKRVKCNTVITKQEAQLLLGDCATRKHAKDC